MNSELLIPILSILVAILIIVIFGLLLYIDKLKRDIFFLENY